MSFPQTSKTLIFRVVTEGNERDWHQFLSDYWLPVCRFAQQRAKLGIEDAEDVASETFEAILRNQLLQRWVVDRSSKLRTLLCTVVRHILGNRARVQKGRQRLLAENAAELLARADLPTIKAMDEPAEYVDEFYAAWVEGILLQAVEALMTEYHQTGKGDYFRVLHGRVCEQMTNPQIAKALGIKKTDAENYYKAARKRLAAKLRELVDEHNQRYCQPQEADDEFNSEWGRIGQYLKDHGGLEQAITKVYESTAPVEVAQRQNLAVTATLRRLTQVLPRVSDRPAE
ncbi:MAG TPA: sigma-70 family RNA polymerase sigma factor [Phycisphaerales bacterium]|nr:sigma-70 family RNA polymerase sigma factor [Phycisphaerales bacterium]